MDRDGLDTSVGVAGKVGGLVGPADDIAARARMGLVVTYPGDGDGAGTVVADRAALGDKARFICRMRRHSTVAAHLRIRRAGDARRLGVVNPHLKRARGVL